MFVVTWFHGRTKDHWKPGSPEGLFLFVPKCQCILSPRSLHHFSTVPKCRSASFRSASVQPVDIKMAVITENTYTSQCCVYFSQDSWHLEWKPLQNAPPPPLSSLPHPPPPPFSSYTPPPAPFAVLAASFTPYHSKELAWRQDVGREGAEWEGEGVAGGSVMEGAYRLHL